MRMKFTVDSKSKNLVKFEDMEDGQVFKDNDCNYYIKCKPNLSHGYTSNVLNLTSMRTGKMTNELEKFTLVNAEITIKED